METILQDLANYYIIFIFLALVGVFAIIGYFVEKKHPRVVPEEPKLDMEAVAKKGGQGLGATLGQNPVSGGEEVEQLDMNMGPTTFVNTTNQGIDNATNLENANQTGNQNSNQGDNNENLNSNIVDSTNNNETLNNIQS